VLIPLISRNNLLKCFNPAGEPLDCTALFVEFRIEPDWSPALRMFPGSPVGRNITLHSSFAGVFSDIPCIIGCIDGDVRGTFLHLGNLKCLEGWLVEPRIMDICGCNRAGKGETIPIDQSTQFVPLYLFIVIIAGRSPFFRGDILGICRTIREIDLFDLYPDRRRSRKIAWYTPFSQGSRWYRCTVDLVTYFVGTSC
jgi:hypothetical protein